MQVKILIPVYKKELSEDELHSLKQCLSVLNRYPIVLVSCLESEDRQFYIRILQGAKVDFTFENFDKKYFRSITSYSRLLLNRDFYLRFRDVEYILIYQLDAFVFRDELANWCKKDFDYIGAPWFKNYGSYENFRQIQIFHSLVRSISARSCGVSLLARAEYLCSLVRSISARSCGGNHLYKVGNGGVSLRKVSSFLNLFDKKLPLATYPFYVKHIRKKGFIINCIKTLRILFLLLFTRKTVEYYLQKLTDECINEDCFWADGLSNTSIALRVPDVIEAAHFCIEQSPSYLFNLIGNKLPFACHAYKKYEYEGFWKNRIVS